MAAPTLFSVGCSERGMEIRWVNNWSDGIKSLDIPMEDGVALANCLCAWLNGQIPSTTNSQPVQAKTEV